MNNHRERNRAYYHRNREDQLRKMKVYRAGVKDEVFSHYGKTCVCCGEANLGFLTIDHINNDGAVHRREIGSRGGIGVYIWLRDNKFPEGFQTLCYNCNLGRARNGGICPHKELS